MADLTLDALTEALSDRPLSDLAALRFTTLYEPAAGPGAKVYPPTYPRDGDPPYVFETRFTEDGEVIQTVLLDSVAAEANLVEQALLDAVEERELHLPLLILKTTVHGRPITLTSLEMPHRCSDAYLRDSLMADGQPFDRSELGIRLRGAALREATAVYESCPTALVLGTWDSHRGKPELSFKAPRVWVSELYGIAPKEGFRVGSRLDPLGMLGGKVKKLGQAHDEWELADVDDEQAPGTPTEKWSKVKVQATARLSTTGHGNVPPSVGPGGVAIASAQRRAALSLAGLRRLRFPVDGQRTPDRDAAGRAVLAALAVLGDRLAFGNPDLSLRSGCDLVVVDEQFEVVYRGGRTDSVDLSSGGAQTLLEEAVEQAEQHGLSWNIEPVVLTPKSNLQQALEQNLLPI